MKPRYFSHVLFPVCTSVFALLTACGGQTDVGTQLREAWNAPNAPSKLVDDLEDSFAALPLAGSTEQIPWADSYWPNYEGGLSWQWNGDPGVKKPDEETLRSMSEENIAKLSPAEKYDLYVGNYEYPLTQYEERRTDPEQPTWWGLCHGWAQAAAHFSEPRNVTVQTPSGIKIPFGSSDIKALLTFAQQYNRSADTTRFLGLRCDTNLPGGGNDDPNCKGVNAGSLHIVLANHLGVAKKPFMADVRRGSEVWTYPISSYSSKVLAESDEVYASAAEGTVKIVRVETTVQHPSLIDPSWDPIEQTPNQLATENYIYTLELNAEGRIIGGEWEVDERPDFMWTQPPPAFEGFFAQLGVLYEEATRKP